MAATSAHTIIIGAGSAGGLLAERLSRDPSRDVLAPQAGGHPPAISDNSALPAAKKAADLLLRTSCGSRAAGEVVLDAREGV